MAGRILPTGCERKYRLPGSSYDAKTVAIPTTFGFPVCFPFIAVCRRFAFRYRKKFAAASRELSDIAGTSRKFIPSARIVNETRTPTSIVLRVDLFGRSICMLVVSTDSRIYTGPAGGPGLTVYIASPVYNELPAQALVRRCHRYRCWRSCWQCATTGMPLRTLSSHFKSCNSQSCFFLPPYFFLIANNDKTSI